MTYFEAHKDSSDPKGLVSDFWTNEFKSMSTFPVEKDICNFRSRSKRVGMGDGRTTGVSNGADKEWINLSAKRILATNVPVDYVNNLNETDFGNPTKMEVSPFKNHSGNFILNTYTSYNANKFIDKYIGNQELDVCEIGGGWGQCADQMLQTRKINNYTFIDLPQNLYLTAFFIIMSNKDRSYEFVSDNSTTKAGLSFSLPATADTIDKKFDVIINSYSLQEMSKANVDGYIDWIKSHMKDDGIFISINSHGKDEIKKASGFRFHEFDILEMFPSARKADKTCVFSIMRPSKGRSYNTQYLDTLYDFIKNDYWKDDIVASITDGWNYNSFNDILSSFCDGTLTQKQEDIIKNNSFKRDL